MSLELTKPIGAGSRLRDLPSTRASDLVDALLPLVERDAPAPGADGAARFAMSEHTASRFLAQKGLYLSSLGARPNAAREARDTSPLRYLLLFEPGNRWQLGRLVERLHLLGALRLSALRNLKELNKASEQLRDFGRSIDKFNAEMARAPDSSWRQKESKLRDENEKFERIGKACDGGLSYRIERSRYFSSTFNKTVQSLRIRRIEGYQPYDEFVHRRLGSTWDAINRLGTRYDNARRRLDSLNTKVAGSAQIDQQRAQVRLQGFAELAAGLPIAYYGGHVFYGLSVVMATNGFTLRPPWYLALNVDGRMAIWSLLTIAIYIATLTFVHAIHEDSDRRSSHGRSEPQPRAHPT